MQDYGIRLPLAHFDAALVRHKQVGDFQIPVDYVARMHVLQGAQHLQRYTLDLRLGEWLRHVIQHRRQILFAEVHYKEYAVG